VLYVLWLTV